MTEYEVHAILSTSSSVPDSKPRGWMVRSMDEDGSYHDTEFYGNHAEARARTYAERMNEIHGRHISWPHE